MELHYLSVVDTVMDFNTGFFLGAFCHTSQRQPSGNKMTEIFQVRFITIQEFEEQITSNGLAN